MMGKASSFSSYFKDIRIDDLMTSHKLGDISQIITNILFQFKGILQHDYDPVRAQQFVEVLSRDLNNQIVKILSNDDLMFIPYADFKDNYEKCQDIFKKFDENSSAFITRRARPVQARLDRNRPDQGLLTFQFLPLKARLERIFKIR